MPVLLAAHGGRRGQLRAGPAAPDLREHGAVPPRALARGRASRPTGSSWRSTSTSRRPSFRGTVLERFPGHAGLRVGLASQLRQVSSFDESAALYEATLELDPDLPEARVGVALRKMALGELDEAHRLLDFLEEPG